MNIAISVYSLAPFNDETSTFSLHRWLTTLTDACIQVIATLLLKDKQIRVGVNWWHVALNYIANCKVFTHKPAIFGKNMPAIIKHAQRLLYVIHGAFMYLL